MDVILCRSIRFASTFGFSPVLATRNFLETTRFVRCSDAKRWKFKLLDRHPRYGNLSGNYVSFFNHIKGHEVSPLGPSFNKNLPTPRYCNTGATKGESSDEPAKKLSIFAKMKQMTKDYWRILIPVHVITSVGWAVLLYTAIEQGVDIANIMKLIHVNQKYIDMVQNTNAGNWALAYILYKIITPVRYTVTIGCTTLAIRQLSKSGLVKPLSFGKESKMVYKTTESNKPMTTTTTTTTKKEEFKVERQTEPRKT